MCCQMGGTPSFGSTALASKRAPPPLPFPSANHICHISTPAPPPFTRKPCQMHQRVSTWCPVHVPILLLTAHSSVLCLNPDRRDMQPLPHSTALCRVFLRRRTAGAGGNNTKAPQNDHHIVLIIGAQCVGLGKLGEGGHHRQIFPSGAFDGYVKTTFSNYQSKQERGSRVWEPKPPPHPKMPMIPAHADWMSSSNSIIAQPARFK